MILGYGLYGYNQAKAGDQRLKSRQLFSETKTLSAANQEGTQYEIPNLGDVVGFKISVTASATGTLTTPAKLSAIIRDFAVTDKKGEPITQSIAGSDFLYLHYLTNASGTKITETDFSGSAATDTYMVQMSIDSNDLPAKIKFGFNPYSSAAASGATGGSATVDVEVFYRDGTTTRTNRCYKQSLSLVSGTNEVAPYLNKKRILSKIGIGYTEANLTSVLISSEGNEELNMKTAALQTYIDTARAAAHISGKLLLPCAPFVANDRSRLSIVTSSSGTLDLYQFMIDSA
jgi:hypothetical protein